MREDPWVEKAVEAATQVSSHSNRPDVWSSLPAELVGSISSCLRVPDFIRLSAVCSSWNSVLTCRDNTNAHLPHHRSNSPWLLLPSSLGEADEALTFRSISDSRYYRISSLRKYINGRICKGSCNGWLVTLDIPDLMPCLFNPVTKAEICFPPLLTIPDDDDHKMRFVLEENCSFFTFINELNGSFSQLRYEFRNYFYHKIVLSSNNNAAVVIYGTSRKLAITHLGDRAWFPGPQTSGLYKEYDEFQDIIYHEEERRFYATTFLSAVMSFDTNGENALLISLPKDNWRTLCCFTKKYIVISSGDLLIIRRNVDIEPDTHDRMYDPTTDGKIYAKTSGFSILKLMRPWRSHSDLAAAASSASSPWVSVEDLGGCSLFLGRNQSMSLHHSSLPGLKPNCIYFSDDWEDVTSDIALCDAGIFDLETKTCEHFFTLGSDPIWPPSIWKLLFSIAFGLWAGLVIGFFTGYFTSNAYSPVQDVADSCRTGAATNVIFGLALGYKLVIVPIFAIAISTFIALFPCMILQLLFLVC